MTGAENRSAIIAALREMMILRLICASNVAKEIDYRFCTPIGAAQQESGTMME